MQALHTTCWVAQYSYYVCGHLGINLINKTTIPLGQYQCLVSNWFFVGHIQFMYLQLSFLSKVATYRLTITLYIRISFTQVLPNMLVLQLYGYFASLV